MNLTGIKASFSWARFWAMVTKEFIQMRRDRLTLGMMIGIPLIQLILFGFAINSDPKQLPAGVISSDIGPHSRTIVQAMKNSGYFSFVKHLSSESEAREAIESGNISFIVTIPEQFNRRFLRGENPKLLVEADASDPIASANAIGALSRVLRSALSLDLKGALSYLKPEADIVELVVHPLYNPEMVTRYNIVPGLLGVVLTMTMVMITGLAMTRERESGTIENLLSMPVKPVEILLGKITPYVLVGYVQFALILIAARFLFDVPMLGNTILLWIIALLFIAANLAMGITFSTLANNQRQALQMSVFFFLPSILLSGFMFPFMGMPAWARALGEILPLTHFLRIVRGVLLKGGGIHEVFREVIPIALFTVLVLTLGVKRFRRTLD